MDDLYSDKKLIAVFGVFQENIERISMIIREMEIGGLLVYFKRILKGYLLTEISKPYNPRCISREY